MSQECFWENGLSISRTEVGVQGEQAVGTFYVKDTSGQDVTSETLEVVRREIGGTVLVANKSSGGHLLNQQICQIQALAVAVASKTRSLVSH